MRLADFAGSKFQRMANWLSFVFIAKPGKLYETGRLFRTIHPIVVKISKLGQLAIRWNFEPAKSANPTRFLSKNVQGDIF